MYPSEFEVYYTKSTPKPTIVLHLRQDKRFEGLLAENVHFTHASTREGKIEHTCFQHVNAE